MDPDYSIFSSFPTVSESSKNYREAKRHAPMVARLFAPDEQLDDLTLQILKTYGTASRLRLEKDQGGAAEFLEGGQYFNPDAEMRNRMSKTPATSDNIEGFFGVLDMIKHEQSKNISFHAASTLAVWRYNNTAKWCKSLTIPQLHLLVTQSKTAGRKLKKDADANERNAAAAKLKRQEDAAKKNLISLKAKIHLILALDEEPLYIDVDSWNGMMSTDKLSAAGVTKKIATQVSVELYHINTHTQHPINRHTQTQQHHTHTHHSIYNITHTSHIYR